MEKYAHATIGATGFLVAVAPAYEHFARDLTLNETVFGMVIAAGASCFADIDTIKSAAATCLGPVSQAMHRLLKPIVGGHRQGTHSIWGVMIVALLAWLGSAAGALSVFLPLVVAFIPLAIFFRLCFKQIGPWPITAAMAAATSIWMMANTVNTGWLPLAFVIGYILHIFADMFTVDGVQPLYGFPIKRIAKIKLRIPLFRSGGAAEKPLTWLVGLAGAALLCTGTILPQLDELQQRERGIQPASDARTAQLAASVSSSSNTARPNARQELDGVSWNAATPIPRCQTRTARGQYAAAHPTLACGRSIVVCTKQTCLPATVTARTTSGKISVRSVSLARAQVYCPSCANDDLVA